MFPSPRQRFANLLLQALQRGDARAVHLEARTRGKTVTLGLDENGTWVPLLRLTGGSAACNVMSLDVRHGKGWAPTGERGTPEMLAEPLLGPLSFTWMIEVDAVVDWRQTSDQGH